MQPCCPHSVWVWKRVGSSSIETWQDDVVKVTVKVGLAPVHRPAFSPTRDYTASGRKKQIWGETAKLGAGWGCWSFHHVRSWSPLDNELERNSKWEHEKKERKGLKAPSTAQRHSLSPFPISPLHVHTPPIRFSSLRSWWQPMDGLMWCHSAVGFYLSQSRHVTGPKKEKVGWADSNQAKEKQTWDSDTDGEMYAHENKNQLNKLSLTLNQGE